MIWFYSCNILIRSIRYKIIWFFIFSLNFFDSCHCVGIFEFSKYFLDLYYEICGARIILSNRTSISRFASWSISIFFWVPVLGFFDEFLVSTWFFVDWMRGDTPISPIEPLCWLKDWFITEDFMFWIDALRTDAFDEIMLWFSMESRILKLANELPPLAVCRPLVLTFETSCESAAVPEGLKSKLMAEAIFFFLKCAFDFSSFFLILFSRSCFVYSACRSL